MILEDGQQPTDFPSRVVDISKLQREQPANTRNPMHQLRTMLQEVSLNTSQDVGTQRRDKRFCNELSQVFGLLEGLRDGAQTGTPQHRQRDSGAYVLGMA